MEKINFRAVDPSTQDVFFTIQNGKSERWDVQSQKTKYVNGKSSEIQVEYTASLDNPNYFLEENKSINQIQITARKNNGTGTCVLTQNESGNKINLHLTTLTLDYWEIRFNPIAINGIDPNPFFYVTTNIIGESGSMASNGNLYKYWIVNSLRYAINIYINSNIASIYPVNSDILSWSCLDKNGNAFSPSYNIPDNSYFTTKTTGLGSYTLTRVSTPPAVNNDTPILSSRFNPTKKYPLELDFYWGELKNPT